MPLQAAVHELMGWAHKAALLALQCHPVNLQFAQKAVLCPVKVLPLCVIAQLSQALLVPHVDGLWVICWA